MPDGSMTDTMQAFVVDRPSGIEDVRRVALPVPKPGPGEVLVEIGAVSLNFRDLLVIRGEEGWGPIEPRIICSDAAGVVRAVGEGVVSVARGDRIANCFKQDWLSGPLTDAEDTPGPGARSLHGVLAQYRTLPERALVRLPDHLSIEEGATLPCAGVTAWNAVIEQSPLVPGQRVLVLGSGGVSVFALQFARMAGAEVWAMTRHTARAGALRALGAHRVVVAESLDAMSRQFADEGVSVDVVIDVVGGDLNAQARVLAAGGRLVNVGCVDGMTASIHHRLAPAQIGFVSVGSRQMFQRMLAAIRLHAMRPVIDRVFAFDDAVAAIRHLEQGRAIGKVVVRVSDDVADGRSTMS